MSANLAGGAWVKLIAKKLKVGGDPTQIGDYTGEELEFAFAQNANWTEDFNVQPLEVLGHLGPKELSSFGYSLSLMSLSAVRIPSFSISIRSPSVSLSKFISNLLVSIISMLVYSLFLLSICTFALNWCTHVQTFGCCHPYLIALKINTQNKIV